MRGSPDTGPKRRCLPDDAPLGEEAARPPGWGPAKFFRTLQASFGASFLRFLGLTYFGLKGVCFMITQTATLPYFQRMEVPGSTFQLASMVAVIPWSMKGLVGVLSDLMPIGPYHKRGYLLIAALIGLIGAGALSVLPLDRMEASDVWSVAVLFCFLHVLFSTFDLLCEGKYSEMMRVESAGSEVLTLVWVCIEVGSLVGALIVSVFVDSEGPQPLIMVCLPITVLAAWRTAAGDLPEERARSRAYLWRKGFSEPRLFLLAGLMAAGSLTVAFSAAWLGPHARGAVSLAVATSIILWSFRALPMTLAYSNLYMFLISVAYLDLTGPIAYFYTGRAGCIRDGPHFSYSYFLAVSNIVGSAGAALGAVLFQYMQEWTFQRAFIITSVVQVIAAFFDLFIIQRVNIALGVSDEAAYLFGGAACQNIATQMVVMPAALLTSRLCPRGAEATMFAILAGFQNFGQAVGSVLGVQLAELFGVHMAGRDGPCSFENFSALIVVGHCIAPLCCIPLTWLLVPSVKISDVAAFEDVPPPPSFSSSVRSGPSSPASSAFSSPRAGRHADELPAHDDEEPAAEYCLIQDDARLAALPRGLG